MKAYCINRDGSVTEHHGEPDFWMEGDEISWTATEARTLPGNDIYYDDESISDPGEVRASVAGVEVPLPAWFVGFEADDSCSPTVSIDELRKHIALPS